jgi:hypothetical protein
MTEGNPDHTRKPARRAIVVLGMLRSGTSIASRFMAELGASLPKNLMDADQNNLDGYWESVELMSYHDRLLADLARRWDTVTPIQGEWWLGGRVDAWTAELVELINAEFGNSSLFVVKDPRICLLFPIWYRALARIEATPLALLVARPRHWQNAMRWACQPHFCSG